MSNILKSINQVKNLQDWAKNKNNPFSRVPPAIKIIAAVIYIIMVVSCQKEQLTALLMLAIVPVLAFSIIDVPLKDIWLRIAIALPFAFFASVFNIFIDKEVYMTIGNVAVTDGVVSFSVVMIKTVLAVSMILLVAATTELMDISMGLKKIKIPEILITQILLTYRYLLVLFDEGFNLQTAVILRSGERKRVKMKDAKIIIGTLLIKSIEKAKNLHNAMLLRGFDGYYKYNTHDKIKSTDIAYFAAFVALVLFLRFFDFNGSFGKVF